MTPFRRRSLTPGERKLWAEIARSVHPLPGRSIPETPPEPIPTAASTSPSEPPPGSAPRVRPEPPRLKPLVQLERRTARALARGVREVDATLDLHGLTQAEAHRRLLGFLARAQFDGHKLVLVVTGKGRPSDGFDPGERGVLRRMVPNWLSLPDARDLIVGWQEAGPRQGGAGALYVRLRRPERSA